MRRKFFADFKFISGLNACERKSYVFLRKELPVRLANIMKEIALLPDNLLRTPSVGLVSTWYAKSFEEVIDFEKSEPTPDNLEKFCSTLIHIRDRHSDVVQTMAHGILELKESQNNHVEPGMETSIQYFLDRFYMSRISIRMLINQHSKFDFETLRLISSSVFLSQRFFSVKFPNKPSTLVASKLIVIQDLLLMMPMKTHDGCAINTTWVHQRWKSSNIMVR